MFSETSAALSAPSYTNICFVVQSFIFLPRVSNNQTAPHPLKLTFLPFFPFSLLSFNTAFRLSSQAAYLWVVSCSLFVPSQVVEEKWLKENWNTANFCTAGLWQSYFLLNNQLQKAFLTSSTVPSAQICPPSNKIQSRHLINKPNKVFSEAGD